MASAKGSGVGLTVGRGMGEVLAAGDGVIAGVTLGVMVAVADGVGVTDGVGVVLGVGVAVEDCRWHWQRKKAAAPRRPAVAHWRAPDSAICAINFMSCPRRIENSCFSRRGQVSQKVGSFASDILIGTLSDNYLVWRTAPVKQDRGGRGSSLSPH